jgi:hypothetical protein
MLLVLKGRRMLALCLGLGLFASSAGAQQSPTLSLGTISAGQRERTYLYYLPSSYNGKVALPLMLFCRG